MLALALALTLQIVAIHAQSLTGDGAYHLLAGHQALRYGHNSVNLEHPPLVKLLVSLPLLLEDEPLTGPVKVGEALARCRTIHRQPDLLRRATIRGRYVELVVFVLPFFAACFALGRRWTDAANLAALDPEPQTSGATVGVLLVLLTGLSLGILPYLTVLQTDTAVSLAFLLVVLAGMRFVERPGLGAAAVLGAAAGLALAVKFSAVLLGPTVLLAFLLAPDPRRHRLRRLGQLTLAGVIVVAMLESTYRVANLDYDPDLGRATITEYCGQRGTLVVEDELRPWEDRLLALERIDPYLAQWAVGVLGVRAQNTLGVYPSYAFGEVRSAGRWWYFPVVLLIKTPLVVLAALAAAAACFVPRLRRLEPGRRAWLLPLATVALYLGTSLVSSYNLSVRHMLPILPFVYLPAAAWLATRRRIAMAAVAALAIESLALLPLWMSATNTWWLGRRNPTRFALAAGNLEYWQNFVQLARWAKEHEITSLGVLYPALGEDVIRAYLPDARLVEPGDPLPPGWYAVNVTVEQFVPALLAAPPGVVWDQANLRRAAERWDPFWRGLVGRAEDRGWVAGTFHVYRLENVESGR